MKQAKNLKLIGKGEFTKCFLQSCGKKVVLHSEDQVKECMSLGWFPQHRLFPEVKRICHLDDKISKYEMKYYPKVKSLKKNLSERQYKLYKILREIFLERFFDTKKKNLYRYEELINKFKKIPKEFKKEREALIEAVEALTNYSENVFFEISPRNVRVERKKLILLDVFFIRE